MNFISEFHQEKVEKKNIKSEKHKYIFKTQNLVPIGYTKILHLKSHRQNLSTILEEKLIQSNPHSIFRISHKK